MSNESGQASLQSLPQAGQAVTHDGTTYTTIKEGLAYILVPPNARTSVDPQSKSKAKDNDVSEQPQNVFYNPIQQFNRDLSVLAIKAFGEDICERKRQKAAQKHELKKRKPKKRHTEKGRNGDQDVKRRKGNNGSTLAGGEQEGDSVADAAETAFVGGDHVVDTNEDITMEDAAAPPEPAVAGDAATNGTGPTHHDTKTEEQKPNAVPFTPRFRILDALSATGLRALRYAQEIPLATSITANDLLPTATAAIAMNVAHNRLDSKITPTTANALAHMYTTAFAPDPNSNGKYDVIDLDPYGTAAPFLDSAVQALNDNGLLCVTCTDAAVFASCGYSEKTYSLYGGLPIKGPYSHEAGLRLILHSIASTAARYGMAIEPLLSLSIDFYARVFVRVRKSPADVKFLAGKTMLVHQCDAGCGAWSTQMLARNTALTGPKGGAFFKHQSAQSSCDAVCAHCGFKTHVAGPMWGGPLHNPFFVEKILAVLPGLDTATYATRDRIEGMLTSALDELDVLSLDVGDKSHVGTSDVVAGGAPPPPPADSSDATSALPTTSPSPSPAPSPLIPQLPAITADTHPFFFIPSALAKVLHCSAPAEAAIKGALRHAGYRATRSHTKPGCTKTDAPWSVIWEVMREWVRLKAPIKAGAIKANTPGAGIMRSARTIEDAEVGGEEARGTAAAEEHVGALDGSDAGVGKAVRKPLTQAQDPSRIKVVFDEVLGKDRVGKRLLRYQLNPRANWGPMSRAKGPA